MNAKDMMGGCACCPVSRRQFLAAGCAACAGTLGALAAAPHSFAAAKAGKMKLRLIYALHAPTQPGPDWPNVGFMFTPVMEQITGALTQAFPNVEFLTAMAKDEDEAEKILKADKKNDPDGYIVYQMNCWNKVVQTFIPTGKPVLYADFQFGGSGGFLVYTAGFLRNATPNLGFVASSKIEDLIAAVKCFEKIKAGGSAKDFAAMTARVRKECTKAPGGDACAPDAVKTLSAVECVEKMKASKILAVFNQESERVDPFMNIPVERVPFSELNDAWSKADKDESRAVADRWQTGAALVEGVSRETLETSAAMYLGMKAVLKKHEANAITVNCLGGFYGGHIHAYPCLGFHELCNEGLIGACECDVRSTASMVALNIMTGGRPGYISDPVIDTAKGQIIYAHCVASKKPFGVDGPENPFQILTHSEDRQGASVRSILPVGYMTTTIELGPDRKEILFHQGRTVANDPDDRACRTKICAEPKGDLEKLFTMWDHYGWHRVTAYGDLRDAVFALAEATGCKVVEEA